MAQMPELATEDMDDAALKKRSGQYRFLQQIFLGIGGATVFGLVGALATAALKLGGTTALMTGLATSWPFLLGIAAVGVGAVYLGSHFWSEAINVDQQSQARKIAEATRLSGQDSTLVPEQAPRHTVPVFGMNKAESNEAPAKQWTAQFAERASPASFAEKAHAAKATDASAAVSV